MNVQELINVLKGFHPEMKVCTVKQGGHGEGELPSVINEAEMIIDLWREENVVILR